MRVRSYPFKASGILLPLGRVMHVLGMIAKTQISPSVIKPITVYMINKLPSLGTKYHAVHAIHLAIYLSKCVLKGSVRSRLEVPVVSGNQFGVAFIV